MAKRYVSIWFRQLKTDWFIIRQPLLCNKSFVLSEASHGRMIITASSLAAQSEGINAGMLVADARAISPSLQVFDDIPDLPNKLLNRLAQWCIRFTPAVSLDLPDGLILEVTGCSHLWGGDCLYLEAIMKRLSARGYNTRSGMADTIGTAWAVARYAKHLFVIEKGMHAEALLPLPVASLRIETENIDRLNKLGLRQVSQFINMPRSVLKRRFGQPFIQRLHQALGLEEEIIHPVQTPEPYHERLPCLEPIVTATGIEIALQKLIESLCRRLQQEGKGLRVAKFKCYRVDGKIESIETGTNRATHHAAHLFKLFEDKIATIEPALGIELFILDGLKIEDVTSVQEKLWKLDSGLADIQLSELLDRIESKMGADRVHRYLPAEHYWPERSFKMAASLDEQPIANWKADSSRPLQLLAKPEPIEVTAPVPDYPPMLFRYKGTLHKIISADGPERIEQEWWLQEGQHRDYYCVEDENGYRYWLFRSGHYTADKLYQWFIHGFFA
ncbi:MAG: DNA polymerase Y family protein [Chitinophagaceae bacterium]